MGRKYATFLLKKIESERLSYTKSFLRNGLLLYATYHMVILLLLFAAP